MSEPAALDGAPTPPNARYAAAERMRAYRKRRKAGLCCLMIEFRAAEIDELIRRKLLRADARNDHHAICQALYAHLDNTLGAASM